jgi:uncharacterized protein (TIGR03435 family)
MLQSLLKGRFMLAVHRQAKDLSGYPLVVGKNGTKLHPVEGGGEGAMTGAGLVFEGHKMPLSRLADYSRRGPENAGARYDHAGRSA